MSEWLDGCLLKAAVHTLVFVSEMPCVDRGPGLVCVPVASSLDHTAGSPAASLPPRSCLPTTFSSFAELLGHSTEALSHLWAFAQAVPMA